METKQHLIEAHDRSGTKKGEDTLETISKAAFLAIVKNQPQPVGWDSWEHFYVSAFRARVVEFQADIHRAFTAKNTESKKSRRYEL